METDTFQVEKKENKYLITFSDLKCEIVPFRWGEKNKVMDMAMRYHKSTENYYTDTIAFNEQMMQVCIKNLEKAGQKIAFVDLESSAGDKLLDICLEVNEEAQQNENVPEKYEMLPEGDLYKVTAPNVEFCIKKWTFGEKMNAVKSCSIYDPLLGDMRIQNGAFTEVILLTCCKYLKLKDQVIDIDLENIRNLPVAWGDFLSDIAINLNSTKPTQKKI